ncbi:MAG: class I SAM-dependent methyltransferase [Terriglobales bacterium]
MALHQAFIADAARDAALQLLDDLLGDAGASDIAVRLWEGTTWRPPHSAGDPRATLVLKDPGALRTMLEMPSDLILGEMYIFDDLDVEGDIEAIFRAIDRLFELRLGVADRLRCASLLRRLPQSGSARHDTHRTQLHGARHSKQRDGRAVRQHYDVSNEFFALWLDRRMMYSCAYFEQASDTLDQAQEQKLDYICRKLRLKQGERLLDIGCGWGGLILHAAKKYGAQALGITLSKRQAEVAEQRIREEGVGDHCRVEVCDYRDLDQAESFDKLVSVGMFEHVGEKLLPEYFRRAWRLLAPGGAFLNHGIARNLHHPDRGPSFIAQYVFPDSELVPISTVLRTAEDTGWEVRDLESLREHYAMTLRLWVQRLEQQATKARQVVDEVTYRIWRLYMAGAAHRFRTGWLNLYQALLVKPERGNSRLPLTRADWYL